MPETNGKTPKPALNVERTEGAFGYVTISGTLTEFRLPLRLIVEGGPETRYFAQDFPVPVIRGEFTMTIHLPPGSHKAVLHDAFEPKADTTFDVV